VSKKKTQLEFLHTFSTLADSGAQIILASDVPPKCLKDLEAGLVAAS
jgi:chromosomal replication initiator protein